MNALLQEGDCLIKGVQEHQVMMSLSADVKAFNRYQCVCVCCRPRLHTFIYAAIEVSTEVGWVSLNELFFSLFSAYDHLLNTLHQISLEQLKTTLFINELQGITLRRLNELTINEFTVRWSVFVIMSNALAWLPVIQNHSVVLRELLSFCENKGV